MNCKYGCGQPGIYQQSNGTVACGKWTQCPILRKKNSIGVVNAHLLGKIPGFSDAARQKSRKSRRENLDLLDIFKENSNVNTSFLKSQLLRLGIPYMCVICSLSEWRGMRITLELDHINGIRSDNRRENLRLLCPNCHSQTPTFRSKNRKMVKSKKVEDHILLNALLTHKSIAKALESVGLSSFGGNYTRARVLKSVYLATQRLKLP